MEGIQTFKGSWPWPWPWIRPYGIPSCITHRPLPIYQISFKSKKLFVDGRTDVRTFYPLILLGRLLEVDLKITRTTMTLTITTLALCLTGAQCNTNWLTGLLHSSSSREILSCSFWMEQLSFVTASFSSSTEDSPTSRNACWKHKNDHRKPCRDAVVKFPSLLN